MKTTYSAIEALCKCQDSLIITANARQNRHIERLSIDHQFSQRNQSKQQTTDIPLNCQSYGQYVQNLWQKLQLTDSDKQHQMIASPHQLALIWQHVIEENSDELALLNPQQLTNTAHNAHNYIQLWRLNPNQLQEQDLDPHFERWLDQFNQKLSALNFITPESAVELVIQAFEDGTLTPWEIGYSFGFDHLTPQQEALFKLSARSFTQLPLNYFNQDFIDTQAQRVACTDLTEQAKAASLWSKDILQANPNAKIAIVAPQLGQSRNLIEQALINVYDMDRYRSDCLRYTLPYNFSAGVPLASTPIVHDAFSWLGLHKFEWPIESIGTWLCSPFIGEGEDDQRLAHQLTNALKSQGLKSITPVILKRLALEVNQQLISEDQLKPSLHRRLTDAQQQLATTSKQLPSAWQRIFLQALNTLNWPGPRSLDSHEFQQVEQFYELLQQLTDFDEISGPCNCQAALRLLANLAENSHFQPQTPASPIQVLGVLEAAGLQFSHIWLMGFEQTVWPPKASPNPLINVELQRQLGMPHASSDRELAFCRSLTEFYLNSAEEVIFSYSDQEDDQPAGPSALIQHLPIKSLPAKQLSEVERFYQALPQTVVSELTPETQAPAISASEIQLVRGGSSLIKDQICCPFIAFAKYRLGVEPPTSVSQGLTPPERGNLLHDIMAEIWGQLQNQQNLADHTQDALNQLIDAKIDEGLRRFNRDRMAQLPPRHWHYERDRLKHFIDLWLAIDLERSEFNVIEIEQSQHYELSGLPLNLRLDRLDQTSHGNLLIDYKTGLSDRSNWHPDKLTEPQLPLYVLARKNSATPINAIAFGQVNAKETHLQGLSEITNQRDGLLNTESLNGNSRLKLPPWPGTWSELVISWQMTLEQISKDFQNGRCAVEFIDRQHQEFCQHWRGLTRIGEDLEHHE